MPTHSPTSSVPQLTNHDLAALLGGAKPPLVIDVLTEEDYKAAHISGAKNACVFNVSFLDDVKKLISDRTRQVVVYGASARDLASATAAEKLIGAGYSNVSDYRGGLEDWKSAGHPIEGNPKAKSEPPMPNDGTHLIDLEKSRMEWVGRNLTGAHEGTIKLQAGHIEIREHVPRSGAFTVDMDSIENTDIDESDMRQVLISHLKSDDFFDVAKFPTAEFQLTSISLHADARPGNPNCEISGNLTLKGVTRDLSFQAILGMTPDGTLAADAHFDIDRTRWNVLYGSGKFYEKLGKHLVNDVISLALKIVTRPFTP